MVETRRLLKISVKPGVRVEVDETGRDALLTPQWLFFLPVLSLYQLLPEILPQFNLGSERIWTDNPWPNSPVRPTWRSDPDSERFGRSWSGVPELPPGAPGCWRRNARGPRWRHSFLPTSLLHRGREKAHRGEAGPRSVEGSRNLTCRL